MATNLNNAMSPRQKGIGSIVEYKGEQYKIVGDKGDDGWELEKVEKKAPDTDPKIYGGRGYYVGKEGLSKEQTTKLTEQYKPKKSEYTHTMDSLEKNTDWNKHANTIYKHESGGKEYSAEEEGFKSAADWLKNRHSELATDLTSLGSLAFDTKNMSDDVKDSWVASMDMYDDTEGDFGSFLRGLKNFGQDPVTIASLITTLGVGTVAKAIGGKAALAAARFQFRRQLAEQLGKQGFKKEVIDQAIQQGASKEITKQAMKKARIEAARTVGTSQATTGALSMGSLLGADEYLTQEFEGGLDLVDPTTGQRIEDKSNIERAADIGKQFVYGAVAGTVLGKALPRAGEYLGRSKALRPLTDDKVDLPEVPVDASTNHTLTKIDVGDDIDINQPKKRSAITEKLIRLNTGAGRLLGSRAALPKALFNAAVARTRGEKAITLEIRNALRTFNKDFKNEKSFKGMSQQEKDDIVNNYLDKNQIDPRLAGTKTFKSLQTARMAIDANEARLNKLLGLEGTDAALGLNRKDGQLYISRTFLSANDPRYLRKIQKILKETRQARIAGVPVNKKLNAEFLAKVEGARKDLRKVVDPKVTDNEIDNIIEEMVRRLAKPNEDLEGLISLENILPSGQQFAGARASILKRRKDLSDPILELLGRENNPYKKMVTTLQKQKRLISEVEFLAQVDEFARTALKKDGDEAFVKLGNFISFLPKQTVRIAQKDRGVGEESLFDLTEKILGKQVAGKNSMNLLKDIYTSRQMKNYLREGIDLWSKPKYAGTRYTGKIFGHVAALGQATQTVLDQGAYLINSYGAFQSLVGNGYLTGSLMGKHGVTVDRTIRQLLNQYSAKDPKFVAELARLKREGVIDTDLSAEIISRGINAFGSDPKNWFTKGYRRTMGTLSEAYGTVDTVAKIYAHNVERENLKKIYKKELKDGSMTDDDIFRMSSERVRDVMPSYSVASPLVRTMARFPIGTYALFPSEVVRNKKNVIKLALKDIYDGGKRLTNDPSGGSRQMAYGMNRLVGAGATATGVGAYVASNNEVQGIDQSHNRFLDMTSPSWGVGSNRYFIQGFEEQEDGTITARYANSAQFDAEDFYKVPIRLLVGRALGGEQITPFEIEDLVDGARNSIIGPYTNPKFLTEAILNVFSNQDRSGRPLYSEAEPGASLTNVKRIVNEFRQALTPGTVQIYEKYNDALKAMGYEGGIEGYIERLSDDEIREMGKTSSGFPLNIKDIENWLTTGIRTTTVDAGRALGFKLSRDIKTMNATKDDFVTYLRRINPQKITPELSADIINEYKRLQNIKFKGFTDLSDKISTAMNMTYTDRKGNVKNFDEGRVLSAATDKFYYNPDESIILAGARSAAKNARDGIFMPDSIAGDGRIIKILTDKFGKDQSTNAMKIYNQLIAASTQYKQVPVIRNQQSKEE